MHQRQHLHSGINKFDVDQVIFYLKIPVYRIQDWMPMHHKVYWPQSYGGCPILDSGYENRDFTFNEQTDT